MLAATPSAKRAQHAPLPPTTHNPPPHHCLTDWLRPRVHACPRVPAALQAVAANDLSEKVSVVHRDVGLLQRGREVRPLGVNLVVTDFFDAGAPWLGLGFLVHRMGSRCGRWE